MKGLIIFILIPVMNEGLVYPWNMKREWSWMQKRGESHLVLKEEPTDGPPSSECWPGVQDAFVRLIVLIKNLPTESQLVQDMISGLTLAGESHGLDLLSPQELKSYICQVYRTPFNGSICEESTIFSKAENVVNLWKGYERFATYIYSNDLLRPPPVTGIDMEEVLTEWSNFAEMADFGDDHMRKQAEQAIKIYFESNSFEEMAEKMSVMLGFPVEEKKLSEWFSTIKKNEIPATIMMANPKKRAIKAAGIAGAYCQLMDAGLRYYFL